MPDTPSLRPATRDELPQSLSFALRFNVIGTAARTTYNACHRALDPVVAR